MKRSGLNVMTRLIGLVKPMLGFMLLAIAMGLLGNLCATFITVFGGYAILNVLHPEWSMSLGWVFAAVLLFALVRGFLQPFHRLQAPGPDSGQGLRGPAPPVPCQAGGKG